MCQDLEQGICSGCMCDVNWMCAQQLQVEAELMAHISAAEKKSNILERQLNQVCDNVDCRHF
jgi:hypothetical protein